MKRRQQGQRGVLEFYRAIEDRMNHQELRTAFIWFSSRNAFMCSFRLRFFFFFFQIFKIESQQFIITTHHHHTHHKYDF